MHNVVITKLLIDARCVIHLLGLTVSANDDTVKEAQVLSVQARVANGLPMRSLCITCWRGRNVRTGAIRQ